MIKEINMKGIIFALLAGVFITLQGVVNSLISQDIGVWQTATITQFTGFAMTVLILLFIRDRKWQKLKLVKPLYLTGGAFGAIVIFSNVTAIHYIGVTLSIAAILIAQLSLTFIIDSKGWFGMVKQRMRLPQVIGIAMMIAGVIILKI
jgi:bacterial/archaeal transporter family-2 protein